MDASYEGDLLDLGVEKGAVLKSGTWLSFKNRQDLYIVFAGDRRMFNPYGVMLVNPAKHPHVKKAQGEKFIDWLISPEGQEGLSAFLEKRKPAWRE